MTIRNLITAAGVNFDSSLSELKLALERAGCNQALIEDIIDESKYTFEHLRRIATSDSNQSEAKLKEELRKALKTRSKRVLHTDADYFHLPFSPVNQFCIQLATELAQDNEPIIQILVPSITVTNYDHLGEDLQDLTENNRNLSLSKFIVSDDGKAIIPLLHWFHAKVAKLPDELKDHLYSDGNNTIALTNNELEIIKNCALPASTILFEQHERANELKSLPGTLSAAITALYKDLDENGNGKRGTLEQAAPGAYFAISKFLSIWKSLDENVRRELGNLRGPRQNLQFHLDLLESGVNHKAHVGRREEFERFSTCVQENGKDIEIILRDNASRFASVSIDKNAVENQGELTENTVLLRNIEEILDKRETNILMASFPMRLKEKTDAYKPSSPSSAARLNRRMKYLRDLIKPNQGKLTFWEKEELLDFIEHYDGEMDIEIAVTYAVAEYLIPSNSEDINNLVDFHTKGWIKESGANGLIEDALRRKKFVAVGYLLEQFPACKITQFKTQGILYFILTGNVNQIKILLEDNPPLITEDYTGRAKYNRRKDEDLYPWINCFYAAKDDPEILKLLLKRLIKCPLGSPTLLGIHMYNNTFEEYFDSIRIYVEQTAITYGDTELFDLYFEVLRALTVRGNYKKQDVLNDLIECATYHRSSMLGHILEKIKPYLQPRDGNYNHYLRECGLVPVRIIWAERKPGYYSHDSKPATQPPAPQATKEQTMLTFLEHITFKDDVTKENATLLALAIRDGYDLVIHKILEQAPDIINKLHAKFNLMDIFLELKTNITSVSIERFIQLRLKGTIVDNPRNNPPQGARQNTVFPMATIQNDSDHFLILKAIDNLVKVDVEKGGWDEAVFQDNREGILHLFRHLRNKREVLGLDTVLTMIKHEPNVFVVICENLNLFRPEDRFKFFAELFANSYKKDYTPFYEKKGRIEGAIANGSSLDVLKALRSPMHKSRIWKNPADMFFLEFLPAQLATYVNQLNVQRKNSKMIFCK